MTTLSTRSLRLLALVGLACLHVACGGGGGGNEGNDNGFTLLREQLFGFVGNGVIGPDPDFDLFVIVDPLNPELPLGVVATDDDGAVFDADPQHPAFAELVALLTNGQADVIKVAAVINGSTTVCLAFDVDPTSLMSDQLVGPDLIGADITRISLRVDAVEVNPGTSYSLNGALLVFGSPN